MKGQSWCFSSLHGIRKLSLLNSLSLTVALIQKYKWKDVVGKFSIFRKEMLPKEGKKMEMLVFESGSTDGITLTSYTP